MGFCGFRRFYVVLTKAVVCAFVVTNTHACFVLVVVSAIVQRGPVIILITVLISPIAISGVCLEPGIREICVESIVKLHNILVSSLIKSCCYPFCLSHQMLRGESNLTFVLFLLAHYGCPYGCVMTRPKHPQRKSAPIPQEKLH